MGTPNAPRHGRKTSTGWAELGRWIKDLSAWHVGAQSKDGRCRETRRGWVAEAVARMMVRPHCAASVHDSAL